MIKYSKKSQTNHIRGKILPILSNDKINSLLGLQIKEKVKKHYWICFGIYITYQCYQNYQIYYFVEFFNFFKFNNKS